MPHADEPASWSSDVAGAERSIFAALGSIDEHVLASCLGNEHPQTAALILAQLSHQQAARVILAMPEKWAATVLLRMSRLGAVSEDALDDVARVLIRDFHAFPARRTPRTLESFIAAYVDGLDRVDGAAGPGHGQAIQALVRERLGLDPPELEACPPAPSPPPPPLGAEDWIAVIRHQCEVGAADARYDALSYTPPASERPGPTGDDEEEEEARLAREWAAMADESNGAADGIMALINSALVNYERLPMLEVIYDRLVRQLSCALRTLFWDNVEVSLDQISSVRFGDYLNSIPLPALISVFSAEEWDGNGLMVADHALVCCAVEVRHGCRGGDTPAMMKGANNWYTEIDRAVAERLFSCVIKELASAFAILAPVTLRHERVESNPRFATIARPAAAAVLLKLRVDLEGRGGRLEVLLPYATVEPIRTRLLQIFIGETTERDRFWQRHLNQVLPQVMVPVAVRFERSRPIGLGALLALRPGDRLELGPTAALRPTLVARQQELAAVALGVRNGVVVARIKCRLTGPTGAPEACDPEPLVALAETWRVRAAASGPAAPGLETPRRSRGLLDAGVRLRIILGETRLALGDIATLGDGAILELDKRAEDPVELYAQDTLVARGVLAEADRCLALVVTEVVGA